MRTVNTWSKWIKRQNRDLVAVVGQQGVGRGVEIQTYTVNLNCSEVIMN